MQELGAHQADAVAGRRVEACHVVRRGDVDQNRDARAVVGDRRLGERAISPRHRPATKSRLLRATSASVAAFGAADDHALLAVDDQSAAELVHLGAEARRPSARRASAPAWPHGWSGCRPRARSRRLATNRCRGSATAADRGATTTAPGATSSAVARPEQVVRARGRAGRRDRRRAPGNTRPPRPRSRRSRSAIASRQALSAATPRAIAASAGSVRASSSSSATWKPRILAASPSADDASAESSARDAAMAARRAASSSAGLPCSRGISPASATTSPPPGRTQMPGLAALPVRLRFHRAHSSSNSRSTSNDQRRSRPSFASGPWRGSTASRPSGP